MSVIAPDATKQTSFLSSVSSSASALVNVTLDDALLEAEWPSNIVSRIGEITGMNC
jgi:hypothetical protein